MVSDIMINLKLISSNIKKKVLFVGESIFQKEFLIDLGIKREDNLLQVKEKIAAYLKVPKEQISSISCFNNTKNIFPFTNKISISDFTGGIPDIKVVLGPPLQKVEMSLNTPELIQFEKLLDQQLNNENQLTFISFGAHVLKDNGMNFNEIPSLLARVIRQQLPLNVPRGTEKLTIYILDNSFKTDKGIGIWDNPKLSSYKINLNKIDVGGYQYAGTVNGIPTQLFICPTFFPIDEQTGLIRKDFQEKLQPVLQKITVLPGSAVQIVNCISGYPMDVTPKVDISILCPFMTCSLI